MVVGEGQRGRLLSQALEEQGHVVQHTAPAEHDSLATLVPLVEGVSVVCWLAPVAPERMVSFVDYLVDTQVRGLVCDEASGAAEAAERRGEARDVPVTVVRPADEGDEDWLAAARAAVASVLFRL